MDISGLANGVVGVIAKKVLIWSVGSAISLFVGNEIRKLLQNINENVTRRIKGEIANIEDENLREAARHVVRYVASRLPNESGSDKMDIAITKLQEITPDILVTDEKLKVLIESAYLDFKNNLKNV